MPSTSSAAYDGPMIVSSPEPSPTSDNSIPWDSNSASTSSSANCASPPTPSAAKKKEMIQQQILQHIVNIEDRMERQNSEFMAVEREGLTMLDNFLNMTAEFNKQVLELLKK